jgi:hypothetical protein
MKNFRSLSLLIVVLCWWINTPFQCLAGTPELSDKTDTPQRNLVLHRPIIAGMFIAPENLRLFDRWAQRLEPADQKELEARVGNEQCRWELRLLYAAALAIRKNAVGQQFLVDQAEKVDLSRIADVFWAIAQVWQSSDHGSKAEPQTPDMAWAEALMLKALADTRPCSPKYFTAADKEESQSVRQLAIEHGKFDQILSQCQCVKVIPILCDYLKTSMEMAPAKNQFSDFYAVSIACSLFSMDDPTIEPMAINVATRSLASDSQWYDATKASLAWLVQRKLPSATPLITNALDSESVYSVVVGTQHPPYLEAIRAKLPELQDGELKDAALSQQQYRRAHAEIILMLGEEKDPAPKLMDFIANPKNKQRHFAVYQLQRLHDPRVADWASKLVLKESDWYLPFCLIDLLRDTPGVEAENALVGLFDYAFGNVVLASNVHYTTQDYHNAISKALQDRTGYHLSADAAKWRDWLKKRDADGNPPVPVRVAIEKRFGVPTRSDREENYLNYDLATGDIITFVLREESLLGVERTKKMDLKNQVGQTVTLVGEYGGQGIDGPYLCIPDGQIIDLKDTANPVWEGAFVSITGILEKGVANYRLQGQLQVKKLYP